MNNLNSIVDYLKVFNNINKRPAYKPRTMAQEPRNMYAGGQLVRNTADGSRPGYNGLDKANLKRKTESINKFYDTYGKDVIDEASKKKHGVTFNKLKDKDKRSNFKRKFKKEFEKSGTFMTEEESRKFSAQKRVLKDQSIQIKLLEETNKKEFFDTKKFAKDNNITMKELKKQSNLLQGNIYDKRMLVSGKDMGRATLTWIPEDATISDNALSKLHKSGLITYERNKIDELFYDAFGRPKIKGTNIDNPSFNNKKYLAIKDNLNKYRQLKNAINLKYPSINFELDHPLSKSTLNKIFNASADELTRVNILDAELNNNFKKSLSSKYEKAVSSKNLEAKKAVEKVARDLKLNIGKVSKDLTGYDYGVKEFQKLNIKDEIIKSLKNQKDLSLNFKNYIKKNPDLLKIAGFDDPSKIGTKVTKVTDKHIQGIAKLISDLCPKKASGGRIGFKDGTGSVKCGANELARLLKEGKGNTSLVKKILQGGGNFLKQALNPMELLRLRNLIGPVALGFIAAFEGGVITDDVLRKGTPLNESLASNWMTKTFLPYSEEAAKQKNLLQSGKLTTDAQRIYALDMMKLDQAVRKSKQIEEMKFDQTVEQGGMGMIDESQIVTDEAIADAEKDLDRRMEDLYSRDTLTEGSAKEMENIALMNEMEASRMAKKDYSKLFGKWGTPLVNKLATSAKSRGPMTEKAKMKIDYSLPTYDRDFNATDDELLNVYKQLGLVHPRFGKLAPGSGTYYRMQQPGAGLYGTQDKFAGGGLAGLMKKYYD